MSLDTARPIALVGIMGAGKSAVARVLGERLGVAVADLDDLLEAETGSSIAELFEREGEPAFRRREGEILRAALAAGARVLACGGGLVIEPSHRALLRQSCLVAWLEISPAEAVRRIERDPRSRRPLLEGGPPQPRLERLLESRMPLYRDVADVRVQTSGRTPEKVAEAVLLALHQKA